MGIKNKRKGSNARPIECDHAVCGNCYYLGEGDMYCDVYEELVFDDWCPTEHYLRCTFESERKMRHKHD